MHQYKIFLVQVMKLRQATDNWNCSSVAFLVHLVLENTGGFTQLQNPNVTMGNVASTIKSKSDWSGTTF